MHRNRGLSYHFSMQEEMIQLNIHGIGSHGEGVGSIDGYTLFVDGALPGETIDVKLTEKHKRYGRGELLKIHKPSSDRIEPACPLFGKCGGCQLMHATYAKQLLIKQQKVIDALERIGKLKNPTILPCLPSPSALGYRNKIQLPVQRKKEGLALGLYARSSHELIEVDHCFIHCDTGEKIYQPLAQLIKKSGLSAYDATTGKGELRHVLIKSSLHANELLVILVANASPSPLIKQLAQEILALSSTVKGIIHNLNTAPGNVILGKEYTVLEGQSQIEEKLCGLTFKISPASFFQVNPLQAENLYAKVCAFAALTGTEKVLDACCGVGTLSLILAKQAREVIGVECIPEAIADAHVNAACNGISNVSFVCDHIENFIQTLDSLDVLILNPPRKGCEVAFLAGVKKLLPKRIVYVSCDPATLARDLALLVSFGYKINAVQPFDMFPQTAHVETCVSLQFS